MLQGVVVLWGGEPTFLPRYKRKMYSCRSRQKRVGANAAFFGCFVEAEKECCGTTVPTKKKKLCYFDSVVTVTPPWTSLRLHVFPRRCSPVPSGEEARPQVYPLAKQRHQARFSYHPPPRFVREALPLPA